MNVGFLVNKVKYNKNILCLYRCIGSFIVNIISRIVKKEKLILFVSFGGRRFDDSPKAIYDALLEDRRFNDYKIVWAFVNPNDFTLKRGKKVKIDTLSYYKYLLKATCWITNSSVERGLSIYPRKTLYFNTWHGTPLKKMGEDMAENTSRFKGGMAPSIILSQANFDVPIIARLLESDEHVVHAIGLPRNDDLINFSQEQCDKIRSALKIPQNKKVILYAPTYREYLRDKGQNCIIIPPINWASWEHKLGKDYILLFRAHYEVAKAVERPNSNFFIDVSDYPNINDLFKVADLLISDYSSVYFDFSITGKPMMHFCYDYDEYDNRRGLYFDIRDWLDGSGDSEELADKILNADFCNLSKYTEKFRTQFISAYGNASSKSLDLLWENLK